MIFKYFIFHAEHIIIGLIMKYVFYVMFARYDVKNLILLSPEVKKKKKMQRKLNSISLSECYLSRDDRELQTLMQYKYI